MIADLREQLLLEGWTHFFGGCKDDIHNTPLIGHAYRTGYTNDRKVCIYSEVSELFLENERWCNDYASFEEFKSAEDDFQDAMIYAGEILVKNGIIDG